MMVRRLPFLLALAVLPACEPKAKHASGALLESPAKVHWQGAAIPQSGPFDLKDGELTLHTGKPMTGVRFDGWETEKLPVTNYEIAFEARRVEGSDFFAALTFPVRKIDTCATLVLGGWGGAVVGISSIDDQDANENSTRSEQTFVNSQWYRIRLQVKDDELQAWIDDRLVINTSIKGRSISLRPGDIEQCAPFGFATYRTEGQVRGLVVRRLQ